jgi:NAD+ synthase (glutamine-hydrolysing)
VVVHRGTVLGVVPKSYLPNYRQCYQRRQTAPGDDERGAIWLHDADVPFGPQFPSLQQICPVSYCTSRYARTCGSVAAQRRGRTGRCDGAGEPVREPGYGLGKADERKLLVRWASLCCVAAYVYAAAGGEESSTDLAWDGQTMIYENGFLLAESDRFPIGGRTSVADVHGELLRTERLRPSVFDENRHHDNDRIADLRRITFAVDAHAGDLKRHIRQKAAGPR